MPVRIEDIDKIRSHKAMDTAEKIVDYLGQYPEHAFTSKELMKRVKIKKELCYTVLRILVRDKRITHKKPFYYIGEAEPKEVKEMKK